MLVNTVKTNTAFTAYFDGQFRSSDHLKHIQTIILRPGLNYNIRRNIIATVGYAFVESRRTVDGIIGHAPEHRIWEQMQVMHPLAFTTINHRLRLEQRFISKSSVVNNSLHNEGNNYANRIRYFFRDIIPFNRQSKFIKGAFAALQNEIFINIGDKSSVNGKLFDQNRAYAALGYRFGTKMDLEAGYLNQYISGRSKAFTNNHNIQIAYYIRL